MTLIWSCRATLDGHLYVSAMGAAGMVTAPWFNLALMLTAAAAVLVSTAVPPVAPRCRALAGWPLAGTFTASGAMFAFAASVPCTPGCPVPFTPSSSIQDLLHVTAATIGFATAVLAILQVWSAASGAMRTMSGVSALIIAAASLAGATGSLTGWRGGAGGWLEFAATTVALAWLTAFATVLALPDVPLSRAFADIAPAPTVGSTTEGDTDVHRSFPSPDPVRGG